MVGREKGFLAMENRRIESVAITGPANVAARQINGDGLLKCWMGLFREGRVGEEGKLQLPRAPLEDIEFGSQLKPITEPAGNRSQGFRNGEIRTVKNVNGRGKKLSKRK
jgi:hypothetical protein